MSRSVARYRSRGWRRARARLLAGGVLLLELALVGPASVGLPAPSSTAAPSSSHPVPRSIGGDCRTDVTAALNAFLASVPDHSSVSFAPHGCYRVDGTLELVGRHALVIDGQDATIRATTVADDSRSHWRFVGGSDITVRNMRIVGADSGAGTAGAFVAGLQHQMGIDLRGVTGVRIVDLTISHVYGDCVYMGAGHDGSVWTTDVEVRDSICVACGRSGASVTAGRDITLADNMILQPGLWGVDIEPNGGATGAVGVTVSDNLFTPGAGVRPFVQAVGESGGGAVSGIAVLRNTVRGGSLMTRFEPAAGQRWSDVTFSANTSDTSLAVGSDTEGTAVVNVQDIDGITVADNQQPGAVAETFLYATGSCRVQQSGNSFPGGGRLAVILPYYCGR